MEKYKKSYKNNRFKISGSTWNEKYKLPDGSYSLSYIQDYFEYVIKKHEKVTVNTLTKRYVNKKENMIPFKNF